MTNEDQEAIRETASEKSGDADELADFVREFSEAPALKNPPVDPPVDPPATTAAKAMTEEPAAQDMERSTLKTNRPVDSDANTTLEGLAETGSEPGPAGTAATGRICSGGPHFPR